jgi:hypothetical protein
MDVDEEGKTTVKEEDEIDEWTCPGSVDTFPSRSGFFFQSNLLELSRA